MSYRRSLKDWYYQRKWFQHHPQPDGESSIDDEYDEERSTRSLSTTSGHPMRPRRAGTNISLRKGEQFLRRPTNRARLRQIQKGGRRVFVNLPLPKAERNANGTPKQCYASNRIVTSKYTILTFVPKNLFFQFSRLANVYFLGMAILQLLPYFGINSPALTLLPICSVLVISAVKDAFEDYQRHTLDHRYNTQVAYTLAGYRNVNYGTDSPAKKALNLDQSISSLEEVEGKFHPSTSEHVRVGDFLLLRNGDKVPSDCVLLASSDETGICFVETKDLDGETNLKARQAMSDTLQIQSGQECLDLHFYVEAEAPHPNLYHFDGTMVTLGRTDPQDAETTGRTSNANWEERSKLPITIDNMLLRGHVIRNTRWIIANVVFTGVDTKIMLNSGETPTKRSEIEKELNEEASGVTSRSGMSWSKQLIFNVDLSFGNGITIASERNSLAAQMWDDMSGTPAFNGFITFWASLVIFQNIIPISLYVSIEFVKTLQAYFIYNDIEMYDEESDSHCIPRSWNLSDDLGQVQYVFSDKTGTLTRNIMEFRKCTINGKIYGDNGFSPESEGARGARLRREQEESAVNDDPESAGEKNDPEEEMKEFLQKRDIIFDQYKDQIHSVFQPKYSSLDIDKLTFADPQVFKDLKGEQGAQQQDSHQDKLTINEVGEKAIDHRPSVTPSLPAYSNQRESVYDFFTALCLCHTAVVEKIDKQGNPIEEMQADESEDTGKPDPSIIIPDGSDGKLPNSGSKTSTLNDSVGTSALSTTATASDGETPMGSTTSRRSRIRNALHKHTRRLTSRSSKPANMNRRGSRGREFDALPGTKPKNVDTTVEQQLNYKSESPDESALVAAAKNVGFTFLRRKGSTLTIDILGQQYEYELLNVIEFNSTRKRMSIIVKRPSPWNDIVLYCKGADNVIIERLEPGQEQAIGQVSHDIEGFSNEGLRTLVLAYKIIPEQAYSEWSSKYHEASTSSQNRAELMDEVNESMEDDLILLGATAIEDKLQDQVPDCIECLRRAGINVWVLTGDKVETAINIGYASNLLSNDSKLWIVRGAQDSVEVLNNFEDIISQMEKEPDDVQVGCSPNIGEKPRHNSIKGPVQHALVIDGLALKHLLETEESKARLLQVVLVCKSVVCCRVSPLQKALVVELVRRGQGAVTLAIGDGANDVSMIQAANIGVGIAGQEGAQASMSADYAIGQFKFLKKLLLVQGHWSYDRISEMILNFFYKNVAVLTKTLRNIIFIDIRKYMKLVFIRSFIPRNDSGFSS
ncbi:hypothetical protein VKS41_003004 [Umbelopsis sp. WA50703]